MIEVNEIKLEYKDLPQELSGVKLIHLSDLHSQRFGVMECTANAVLNQHKGADALIFTGDLCHQFCIPNFLTDKPVNGQPRPRGFSKYGYLGPPKAREALDMIKKIIGDNKFPLGIYAIQGNHDSEEFMDMLSNIGIKVLKNSAMKISKGKSDFYIGGLNCHCRNSCDIPKMLADVEPGKFLIGLTHYPEFAEGLIAGGARLVLAGHTHGGQICRPGGKAIITHSRTGQYYVSGLNKIGDSFVFTNRGLGNTTIPIRMFCKREIGILTLLRKT